MNEIYFDNSATTRPYDQVSELVLLMNKSHFGNPSSLHRKGLEAEKFLSASKSRLADALRVLPSELVFTSGGTEANNLGIMGYLSANTRTGKHIITTKIEHASVMEVFRHLETKGYKVDYLDVDSYGFVDKIQLEEKVNSQTSLVSIIYVNNETGTIQDISALSQIIKAKNPFTVLHCDCIQAFCKIQLLPSKAGIDLLSLSSHKIHGPKGSGALYIKQGIKIAPLFYGGGHEKGLRSGTENVPGLCGMGLAAEIMSKSLTSNFDKVTSLKNNLLELLSSKAPSHINLSPEKSSPYILNISFPGVRSEVLLHSLEEKGVFVSSGSACSSRKKKISHVLSSMGKTASVAASVIRISFSHTNNQEEVIEFVDILAAILPKIAR